MHIVQHIGLIIGTGDESGIVVDIMHTSNPYEARIQWKFTKPNMHWSTFLLSCQTKIEDRFIIDNIYKNRFLYKDPHCIPKTYLWVNAGLLPYVSSLAVSATFLLFQVHLNTYDNAFL